MKKLKISSLMNEYQDQESEPVPQPGLVDGERVRQRVLDRWPDGEDGSSAGP